MKPESQLLLWYRVKQSTISLIEHLDEPLGRDGGPRHVDAVALGEADATWPRIVEDAARGELHEVYSPVDPSGKEIKPSLQDYPQIAWDRIDLTQFDLIGKLPQWARYILKRIGMSWQSLCIVPMESGRGCPYGCDFCTVTGFFGDSIRFRTNESVVDEMLLIKSRAEHEQGKMAIFFIDDNFAINVKRTKSLLREIIRREAVLPWVAQISINLLRDEELLNLITSLFELFEGHRTNLACQRQSVKLLSLTRANGVMNRKCRYGNGRCSYSLLVPATPYRLDSKGWIVNYNQRTRKI